MKIEQKYMNAVRLDGRIGTTLHIGQDNDIVIIEPESIPELLKFIKENYNL